MKITTTIYVAILLISIIFGAAVSFGFAETDAVSEQDAPDQVVPKQDVSEQEIARETAVQSSPAVAETTLTLVEKPTVQEVQVVTETLAGDGFMAQEIARAVHKEVNAVRYAHGVRSVTDHDAITSVALQHSIDMQQNAYFAHINLRGEKPLGRFGGMDTLISRTGCRSLYSENLALLTTGDDYRVFVSGGWQLDPERIATKVVQMWMASEQGHRENMLMVTHRLSGIGVSVAVDQQYGYRLYVTQNFCS